MELITMLIIGGGLVGSLLFLWLVWTLAEARFYIRVEQGKALIINRKGQKDPQVVFTGARVMPLFDKAEMMDISVKTIDIDRRGKEGLICKDNIRADIRVMFFVRVNKTVEDVLEVAQSLGCARASDPRTLEDLFEAKFSEALKTAGKSHDFAELYTRRTEFRDMVRGVIGEDLNGYVLEDVAIDYLEQTPLTALDETNIMDAEGIRKITEITHEQRVQTNYLLNEEKKRIKTQDVEANAIIMEQDRLQADAQTRQTLEVESARARGEAEIAKIQAEERKKAEAARIEAEREIQVMEENKHREIEVANANRQRVVNLEKQIAQKEINLKAIEQEREVELMRIAKEKALEEERKEIQEVIRQRIAVEKNVVEEEERIKTLRVQEESKRSKDSVVIAAEARAEEQATQQIKQAEAAEAVARLTAKQRLTLAEAELAAADKEAQAKVRMSEGVQAERAAEGLAKAKVQEAETLAFEKQGMAEVRVKEAQAPANEKLGMVEASIKKAQAEAEAESRHKVGMAEASVAAARAEADAQAIQKKLLAEAAGLSEKAKAMKALDDVSRRHEEYRLELENQRIIALESLKTQKELAEAQAKVMAEVFKSAKIDIVGGDGAMLDRIFGAISMSKSMDRFMQHSDAAKAMLGDYMNGERSLAKDLKDILSNPSMSSEDLKNLSVSSLLASLIKKSGGTDQAKLMELARSLGMEALPPAAPAAPVAPRAPRPAPPQG
ncbi:MAG: hypothetical protein AMXMBFR33_09040 [Candidatus Xenobia bacterium]